MSGADFVDTDVLVYAYDATSPRKQRVARELLKRALLGEGLTSAQVLGEFASTLLHKIAHRAGSEDVLAVLHALGPIKLVSIDADTVRRAVEAHKQYGIHFYDGMIVAAAERAGCKRILSEDFHDGQDYFGVTAENPFR